MQKVQIDRLILALTDDQLEAFVREWVGYNKEYVEVQRFTGPGDMGRDVVGYLTIHRHACTGSYAKARRILPSSARPRAVGNVRPYCLYYSHCGEFTIPTAYFFVAPRGVNRNLKGYISRPRELKDNLLLRSS